MFKLNSGVMVGSLNCIKNRLFILISLVLIGCGQSGGSSKSECVTIDSSEWVAKWINDGKVNPAVDADFYKEDPAPLFRKEFTVDKKIKSATLFITGLGYYVSYLNGERIGKNYLDPSWTSYDKRVYYSTYDVTELLSRGENCMGVTLGNGWFNPLPLKMWGGKNIRESLFVGRPSFISQLRITYRDGSEQIVASDESWRVTEGALLRNSIYLGEEYDARKEVDGWNRVGIDDSGWKKATISDQTFGELQSQPLEPIQITDTIKPIAVTSPSKGVYIVDMGVNFVGLPKFRFSVNSGDRIAIRYGELLTEDGELNPMTSVCGQIKTRDPKHKESVGGEGAPMIAWQGDVYIAKGGEVEEYMPNFTFHGFRYIEIEGLAEAPTVDDVVGYRLHSNVDRVGEFSCSNPLLNQIQTICTNTFVSNIIGVQSDCPHRERFGYGGDIVATSEAFIYNFDMSRFYAKTTNDWLDARIDGGRFTDTAPFVGIDYCGLGWAMANPLLQYHLYRYYGDRKIVEENYDAARVWLDKIIADNTDNIIEEGLSDHESLSAQSPDQLVTALYYQTVDIMELLASVVEREDDAKRYNALKKSISDTYVSKFFDKASGKVGDGSQAAQAFALYTGVVPYHYEEVVMKWLVDDIKRHNGELTTGIMATKFMLSLLSEFGYHDVAMKLVTSDKFPSWGYMLKGGATTLWEHWAYSDDTYSHNHPMFGSVSEWFYKWVGGIQLDLDAVGFDRIVINPMIEGSDLDWVKCSYNSVNGVIVSNWSKTDEVIVMEVEIPSSTEGYIIVPNGKSLSIEGDVQEIMECGDSDATAYSVEAGRYKFTIGR